MGTVGRRGVHVGVVLVAALAFAVGCFSIVAATKAYDEAGRWFARATFNADAAVSEVMVNGTGDVWVERGGRLQRTDVLLDAATTGHLIERVPRAVARHSRLAVGG